MARRTKAEAEETRQRLLDAAVQVFRARGVSSSTLDEIAQLAGTTRGAIAWHFKDKAGLLEAMVKRIGAPMEAMVLDRISRGADLPLTVIVAAMTEPLRMLASDPKVQDVVTITFNMMEYTPDLAAFRLSSARSQSSSARAFEKALIEGARLHGVKLKVPAALAGRTLSALLFGLMQTWVLEPSAYDLTKASRAAVLLQLRGIGFTDENLALYGLGTPVRAARKKAAC